MVNIDLLVSLFKGKKTRQSFETITELLQAFDNPQHRLPPVIHITGTNGKGSTTAFLYAAFVAAGLRVHRLISPHLWNITERITLANVSIAYDELAYYLHEIARMTNGEILFPEAITATAMILFAQVPADIALIEVGVGGLHDGTNVVSTTCASVITSISMDHQHILGPTYGDIAAQKSGIMRPNMPCISGQQRSDVQHVLMQNAEKTHSPLLIAERDWFFWPKDAGVCIQYAQETSNTDFFPSIGLVGAHQRANAALAAMTLHTQRAVSVPFSAIDSGFQSVVWPGRLQPMPRNLFGFSLEHEVWLDGAHNAGGFQVLSQHIQQQKWHKTQTYSQPFILVVGMLPKKNAQPFWRILAPLADQVWVVESWGKEAGASLETMQRLIQEDVSDEISGSLPDDGRHPIQGNARDASGLENARLCLKKAYVFKNMEEVFRASHGQPKSRFLVCGSLHLVGWILGQQDQIGSQ